MTLILMSVCMAFGIGFFLGREISEAKFLQRIMDAERDRKYWQEIASRAKKNPGIQWSSEGVQNANK